MGHMPRKIEALPPKDESIKLRISAGDLRAWQEAARLDAMKLSDWIRRRCNGQPAAAPVLEARSRRKGAR
jgi:hypothetical protein